MAPVARTMVAKFAAMTKDCPIKMSSITKLERDGGNYRHWEIDFLSYVGFIPDIAGYVSGETTESSEDYKQEFADVMNCIIHWTIDCKLSLSLQDIPLPFMRMEELQEQFSGISFAARQAALKELYTMIYDSKSSNMDQHVMAMREKKDHLARIGLRIPDDIFAVILSNSVPSSFPDIATSFEGRLLIDESHVVSSSDVKKALGAADVSYRRAGIGSEVLKVWAKPRGGAGTGDPRTCFWCDLRGHTIRECRKKKEHDKNKASGSQTA